MYDEIFALSQKEKKGVTIHIKGQTIPGIVTRIIDGKAVELRSQMFSKIVVKIDSIDAVAMS